MKQPKERREKTSKSTSAAEPSYVPTLRGVKVREEATLPTTTKPNLEALKNVMPALQATRNEGLAQGIPSLSMAGFVFDLSDTLVPAFVRNSPAAQEALKQARGGMPLQAGIVPKNDLAQLLEELCYRIEGREKPMIISSEASQPPVLVQTLLNWRNADEMPVVVIVAGGLSVLSMPVSRVISPAKAG